MGASRHGVGLGPAWVGGVGEWVSRLGRRWSGLELVGGDWRAGCGESTPPGPAPSHTGVLPGRAKAAGGSCCSLGPGGGKAGPHTTHSPALPKASSQPPTTPLGLGIHGKGAWLVPHAPTYPLHTTELPDLHTHLQQLPRGAACLPLTRALLARPSPVAGHQDQTQEKRPGQGLGFRVRVHK